MKKSWEILKDARAKTGMSIREVAKAIGWSFQAVGFSESGTLKRKMVSANLIRALAEFYQIESEPVVRLYEQEQDALAERNRKAKV